MRAAQLLVLVALLSAARAARADAVLDDGKKHAAAPWQPVPIPESRPLWQFGVGFVALGAGVFGAWRLSVKSAKKGSPD